MKFIKKTAVALAMLATAGSSSVFAATTTANIDATAGLQPVLSVTCTPVKFGVWRIPTRSSGGTTTITLSTISDTATFWQHRRRRCHVVDSCFPVGTWRMHHGGFDRT